MRRLFAICAGLVGLVMLAGPARAAPSSRPAPHALGTDFAELAAEVDRVDHPVTGEPVR